MPIANPVAQPLALLYSSNCGGRLTAVCFFVVLDVPNVNGTIVYVCVPKLHLGYYSNATPALLFVVF